MTNSLLVTMNEGEKEIGSPYINSLAFGFTSIEDPQWDLNVTVNVTTQVEFQIHQNGSSNHIVEGTHIPSNTSEVIQTQLKLNVALFNGTQDDVSDQSNMICSFEKTLSTNITYYIIVGYASRFIRLELYLSDKKKRVLEDIKAEYSNLTPKEAEREMMKLDTTEECLDKTIKNSQDEKSFVQDKRKLLEEIYPDVKKVKKEETNEEEKAADDTESDNKDEGSWNYDVDDPMGGGAVDPAE